MPLVEVIHGPRTSAAAQATTVALARTLRKTPVLVKNREGFLVSRVFVPYLKEAFWLWQEGAEPDQIDRAMVAFGFPMGPLALIDMAGLDILERTDRILRNAFSWHGPLPPVITRLTEAGCLGQKSGSGVYGYAPGDHSPRPSPVAGSLIDELRRQEGIAVRPIGGDEITERLVLRMVSEAFYVLEEGIARQPSDLDVATVLGIGFPDFRGGVLRYAEDQRHARVLKSLEKLSARHGARFAPCELLRAKGA
jgi:3-hydroxyacyl-CoA dehydrogenase